MALGAAVKGITIQFNGENRLGATLKEIDRGAKNTEKALKTVNNALKYNPKNTDLLAQKQVLLTRRIQSTKDKLDALKQAQATMDASGVDKTSDEYMELQREIIMTESKLKNFKGQLEALKAIKFQQIGQSVKDVGNKMQAVGKGMSTYVTAPIAGVGAASLKAFKDVDEGLDIVTKKTGASGKELGAMQESVKNLAKGIPTDFKTAGAAVGEVNTRFGLTGKALENLSGKFVKFAELNDTDVSTAIDMTQKSMEAFGIESKDAGGFLDVLNSVGQKTGIGMDALNDALVKNAPALEDMGLSAEESANFIGQLEKSGVDSSKVMSGLGKALAAGAKEGKSLPDVMGDIEKSVVGAKDETKAIAKASEIFGNRAGPMIAKAARDGALDFKSLGKAVGDAGGSVDKTFNETLDPIDKFKTTLNSAKIAGAEIGTTLMQILAPALDKLASGLQKAAKWWEGLSPGMQSFIVKAGLVAAAIGPALVLFGKLVTGIGGLITIIPKIAKAFQLVGVAFKALGAIFTANPILIAVMAAVAAGVLLYKNWDKVKKILSKVWKTITSTAGKIFRGMKDTLGKIWETIKNVASKAWNGVKNVISAPIKALVSVIKGYINTYKSILSAAWDAIKNVASKAWNAIKKVISDPIEGLASIFKTYVNIYKTVLSAAWNAIKDTASKAWNGIKDAITAPLNKAKEGVTKAYDAMKKKVAEKVSAAGSWVTDVKDKITNALSSAKSSVAKSYKAMSDKVKEKVAATDTWNGSVRDKIKGAIGSARDAVKGGIDKIKGYLGTKVSLSDSLSSFGSSIADKASKAWKAVKGAFNKIKNKIEGLKINFPTIKVPKIKVNGGKAPWGIAGKGQPPSFDVKWNKKGGIFTKPTLLGGGQGVGEAGAEAVLPLDRLFTEMDSMMMKMGDSIVNGILTAQRMQAAGTGAGDVVIPIYLYPSGPKMGEEIVKTYDRYKKMLKG